VGGGTGQSGGVSPPQPATAPAGTVATSIPLGTPSGAARGPASGGGPVSVSVLTPDRACAPTSAGRTSVSAAPPAASPWAPACSFTSAGPGFAGAGAEVSAPASSSTRALGCCHARRTSCGRAANTAGATLTPASTPAASAAALRRNTCTSGVFSPARIVIRGPGRYRNTFVSLRRPLTSTGVRYTSRAWASERALSRSQSRSSGPSQG